MYESVILADIEFSDTQNVDQLLWKNVFYQVIERFRQLLKNQYSDTASQIRAVLLTILQEVHDLIIFQGLFLVDFMLSFIVVTKSYNFLMLPLCFNKNLDGQYFNSMHFCCYLWLNCQSFFCSRGQFSLIHCC